MRIPQSVAWSIACGLSLVQLGLAQNPQGTQPKRHSWADSTPATIMRLGSPEQFPTAVVVDLLRQTTGSVPSGKRRELSDSAVSRAVSSSLPLTSREDAVLALRIAGSIKSGFGGVPDHAALDRLIEIHRRSRDANTRSAALGGLSAQIDPGRALPYLKTVVLSGSGEDKALAIKQVIDMAQTTTLPTATQNQAMLLLREFYDSESGASEELCKVAIRLKWPSPRNGGRCG